MVGRLGAVLGGVTGWPVVELALGTVPNVNLKVYVGLSRSIRLDVGASTAVTPGINCNRSEKIVRVLRATAWPPNKICAVGFEFALVGSSSLPDKLEMVTPGGTAAKKIF